MELWKHQRDAIERAQNLNNYALLFQPGTGKSATLINILRQKYQKHGRALRTLILCPTVVCDNWKREWEKFSKVPKDQIAVLEGSGISRVGTVKSNKYSILICNYQTLLMPTVVGALMDWGLEVIVADESHRLKTPSAKTTKAAIQLAEYCTYRYILTGTPVLKSLMDFYSQFRFLDGGETFGRNFLAFKNLYFYDANANAPAHIKWADWRVRPGAVNQVNEKIYRKASYADKADCLDLPPLLKQKIFVELSSKQKKAYQEMENLFITTVNGETATAQIALTMGLRLMQIVSGFVTTEDGVTRFDDSPKAEALKEILEEIAPHHKVIVWACFKEDYETIREICKKLGLEFVELHGETKDREGAITSFQSDSAIRVLIGNQGAGGIGVNLTAASYAIYYSRSFSLEHDVQSEARNYRGGSELHLKITRIDLVAKGTIDEKVLEALESKQAISNEVLKKMVI